MKDGFNGFLFEPGNVEDMAEKINKLWNNAALCKRMGQNAREYVEKNFGPEGHPAYNSPARIATQSVAGGYAVSIAGRYEKLMNIYRKAIAKHK